MFKHFISTFPKTPIVFISDITFTLLAIYCVLFINTEDPREALFILLHPLQPLIFLLITESFTYYAFGLYRGVWRFASIPDLIRIVKACIMGTFIFFIYHQTSTLSYPLPNYSFLLFCLFTIYLLSGSRLIYRFSKENRQYLKTGKKTLIIGAGYAGESILRELKRNKNENFFVIGLIDDNASKAGMEIHGIRVLGNTENLKTIVKDKKIEQILIAIPTATSAEMRRIVNHCAQAEVPFRTLPSFNEIAAGLVKLSTLREVKVEDLLSRDAIQFDKEKLYGVIGSKKILITGAGGSIGSELCRQIAECKPACIIIIEHSEYNLFQINGELEKHFPDLILHHYLTSITHRQVIYNIMEKHQPDYVFHAAAYKHVPLLEPQIRAAIDNNIFGTESVAEAAVHFNVKKFILVSTDKAVNPSNVMGASKRCAEMICQGLNKNTGTKFITVRFGNVLGSTGSVIPLFKQQIATGGPVTVTHPDMERYFMTIKEAAQLIVQTVSIDHPGDLYVLDMGEPIKIQYLAEQMIKLSGHIPNGDIKIIYSGLRPGEKINEELFYENEKIVRQEQEKIMHIHIPDINMMEYEAYFNSLKKAYTKQDNNDGELKKCLFEFAGMNNVEKSEKRREQLVYEPTVIPA